MLVARAGRRTRAGTALAIAVPFFAMCAAALVAHYAIDLAGDYVLTRDSYDDMPHDSRAFAFCGAIVLALAGLLGTLRLAAAEARGHANVLRAALRAALPSRTLPFAGIVLAGTFATLGAMGALDDALTGTVPDCVADLFGGSLWLGGSIAAACAAASAFGCIGLLRALVRVHRSIVRAVGAFIAAAREGPARGRFAFRLCSPAPKALGLVCARAAAGRAPPPSSH